MNDQPAFPQERTLPCGSPEECEGLSIRDYFAAKAMQAYMAQEIWRPEVYKLAVKASYQLADAMMKGRQE
jgi:hypothetical protein